MFSRNLVGFGSHLRRSWPFAIIAVALILYIFAPSISDALNTPEDKGQERCNELESMRVGGRPDPAFTLRPSNELKVIRLTNTGALVDRCEYTDALDDLLFDSPEQAGFNPARVRPGAKGLPKLVLLYIHGWRHDGTLEDPDRRAFERLVSRLREKQAGQKNVVGIYIAWNGSFPIPLVDLLTFWSKATIADRIAQSGSVTKIVSAVGAIAKKFGGPKNQFIAIGHSFGARILFTATNQSIIYETERAHPTFVAGKYNYIEASADSVILLNPAFEASRFGTIAAVTRPYERFADSQAPVLVSIATDNDTATGTFFPIGQWLGGFRSDGEKTTLGNFTKYQTHELKPTPAEYCSGANDRLTEQFFSNDLCLKRIPMSDRRFMPGNPFMVVRTTKAVIDNHGGIWNDKFEQWLRALISEMARTNSMRNKPDN